MKSHEHYAAGQTQLGLVDPASKFGPQAELRALKAQAHFLAAAVALQAELAMGRGPRVGAATPWTAPLDATPFERRF